MTAIGTSKLSFKYREGYADLPPLPEKEILPQALKNLIWKFFNEKYIHSYYDCRENYRDFFSDYFMNDDNISHESITGQFVFELTKAMINNSPFYMTMDFIERFLRWPEFHQHKDFFSKLFSKHHPSWKILFEGKITQFHYALNDQEPLTIQSAYEDLKANNFGGGLTHLVQAVKFFNESQWNDSIRESITAVESVCKNINGKVEDKDTLTKALISLRNKGIYIHEKLYNGIVNLYGYSNDEKGIRHALIKADHQCDAADAQFMLGACSAFISYLCAKAEIA